MDRRRDQGPADDDDLIRRFQRDPEGASGRAAAGELIARWQGRVYLWALRVVGERDAAMDAAQEALTRMFVALPRYQGSGRFSAWLFTIVHNHCLDRVKSRPLMRDDDVDVDLIESRTLGPEREFESAQAERAIVEAMERALEPHEQMALWLRAFEGQSVADIARLMRLEGASGARSVLQVARRKLRAAIRPGGGSGGKRR